MSKYIANNKIFAHDFRKENPISVDLFLSDMCNNNCYYCGSNKDNKSMMSKETIKKSIEYIKNIRAKSITLNGGGEPTMSPHFKYAVELAKENHLEVGLITNGVLPIENINDFTWIRFSLDANSPEMYKQIRGADKFDQVVDNIKHTIDNKKDTTVGVQIVVNKYNWTSLITTMHDLNELFPDIDYINIRPIESIEEPYDSNQLYVITTQLDKYFTNDKVIISDKWSIINEKNHGFDYCHFANHAGVIDVHGDYYLCCHHVGNHTYKYCNINDETSFYHSREKVIEKLENNGFNPAICPIGCRGTAVNMVLESVGKMKHKNFL